MSTPTSGFVSWHPLRRLTLLFLGACLAALCSDELSAAALPPPTPFGTLHQPAEDDWWLPDWVQPVPNSGVYGGDQAPPGFVDVKGLVLPWRMIEPKEGVYDWSLLTNALARGRPLWLRFFASDVSHCPAWLQRKYPDLKHHRFRWPDGGYDDISGYLTGTTTIRSSGDFYEIWDPRFEAEFRRLLQEFARQGFGRDPRIRFVYFPHAFRWNEYSLKWVPDLRCSKEQLCRVCSRTSTIGCSPPTHRSESRVSVHSFVEAGREFIRALR